MSDADATEMLNDDEYALEKRMNAELNAPAPPTCPKCGSGVEAATDGQAVKDFRCEACGGVFNYDELLAVS